MVIGEDEALRAGRVTGDAEQTLVVEPVVGAAQRRRRPNPGAARVWRLEHVFDATGRVRQPFDGPVDRPPARCMRLR